MDDVNTNKQFRIYDTSGKYIRLSVDEAIARGLNKWQSWQCSAGTRGLYIDFDGNIWVCNTASSKVNKFNDTEWKKTFWPIIGPFNGNVPDEWASTGQKWKELKSEFHKSAKAFEKIIPRTSTEYPGFLGNIYEGFDLPKEWISCPWNSCGCGADVILSKANTTQNKSLLAVTRDGVEGRLTTSDNLTENITEPAAVEMNFPIPYQILWDLSRKCNYDCSYCWPGVHNRTSEHKDYELLIQVTDKLIDEWAKGNSIRWNFGGGEPTLHPKFLDWLKYLKSKNQWTMITSNGTRDHKYWMEAAQYANSINLSAHFDGLKDEQDEDRFVKNVEVICKHFDEHDDDHWLEVKLMAPPRYLDRALKLKEKIVKLNTLDKPGANNRIKGVVSLVPIRSMGDSGSLVEYTAEQLEKFQYQ